MVKGKCSDSETRMSAARLRTERRPVWLDHCEPVGAGCARGLES